ncbi:uncharacterized protein SPAPADRAFT_132013 [Spathaspora passalidarum NRRL Y-27907]|uniref:Monopolar spindle protein 2 n=1 Tax=Spathaspora passalidarum (strain NRRL Y-27907 / 11-Y1) TaxID=619300 RepID=G3AGI5_SPAPN|nr:uncharacterized protein SPAPADRAFT_132013 [Spathaspora passalidarum NRRL Y-27907]EGW35324.1 hypothetical protein SPAPADRAFT_132013 [Spathaspora passalidarum NRRL Y-27907]
MAIGISRPVDDLINLSWIRTARGVNREYIYASQLQSVIAEIEKALAIGSILTEDEMRLFIKLAEKKQDMKIKKTQLKELISAAAEMHSFEELLQTRFNMGESDIRRCLNVPSSGYDEHTKSPIVPVSRPLSSRTPSDERSGAKSDKGLLWEELHVKDKYIHDKDHEIELKNTENLNLRRINREQEKSIRKLDNELSVLKNHVRSLESQLSKIPGERATRNLLTKLKDRDLVIKSLEQVCEEYRENISDLEKKEAENFKELNEIKKTLNHQDQIFENLQKNLPVGSTGDTKLKGFLMNLPFVKQYLYYLQYKHENKDVKMFILNIIALIFAACLVGNILQLIFYVIMAFIRSKGECETAQYVYDDYNFNGGWLTRSSFFDNWRGIMWLEELIYRFTDW